jgi:hypothetical protein
MKYGKALISRNGSTARRPEAHNRVGSFIGPMSSSFQIDPPDAPSRGDIETAEGYGRRVAEITLRFMRGKSVI